MKTELILGLDPGSLRTGFGVLEVTGDRVKAVEHGVIRVRDEWPMAERLKHIHAGLISLYERLPIAATVVEKIFFGKSADSAFKLGHARGICLLASSQHGSPLVEYAARYVKKCVTGSGSASKDHVQMVVMNLLRLPTGKIAYDATDALALALTHARLRETEVRLQRALEREA